MNDFKCQSSMLLIQPRQQNKKRLSILKGIEQYQQGLQSDQEHQDKASGDEQLSYEGFQNKKSLQIKPLNMFKDTISLGKQNTQKRQQVKILQKINDELRSQYEGCINHNKELESFLKEVEFTFQQDTKKAKASEVILRARRTLFQQAKQAKDRLKKMFKNSDVSTVQELKSYIATLEEEKIRLKGLVDNSREYVMVRMKEEDFNSIQIQQFQKAFQKVKVSLQKIFNATGRKREEYKIQKMEIKKKIKIRQLQSKKVSVQSQSKLVKTLLQQCQAYEQELQLLKHRVKDKKKQISQFEQLKVKIQAKHSTIIRLEKELRQKNKTFDYMLQWTKQLKKQLQERKLEHARKKGEFQQQINQLSKKFEQLNQDYKKGIRQQQYARRKGIKDPQPQAKIKSLSVGKQITLQQIKPIFKSMSFWLLKTGTSTTKFIDSLLKAPIKKQIPKKTKNNEEVPQSISSESISMNQLLQNLKKCEYPISPQHSSKISRYIVEDGNGKAEQQTNITLLIARQIIRNLLERFLQNLDSLSYAMRQLKNLFTQQMQGIRQQLKFAGGKSESIGIEAVKDILLRYGADPFKAALISQFLEYYVWHKKNQVGYITLADYDFVISKVKQGGNVSHIFQ